MSKALARLDDAPKKRLSWWWVAAIAGISLAVLAVPMDLLSFTVPSWVPWALTALIVVSVALVWRTQAGKTWTRVLLSVFGAGAILLVLGGSVFNPYWNSVSLRSATLYAKSYDAELTAQQAKADLDAALSSLRKVHPAFLRGVPEAAQESYDKAVQSLKAGDTVTTSEVAASVESVLSSLDDGHTYVILNYEEPRYMKWWDQHDRHTLSAVNGATMDALLEEKADWLSADTEGWARERLLSTLSTVEGLAYLGLDPDEPVRYTYETEDGPLDVVAQPEDFLPWSEYAEFNGIPEDGSADSESLARYEIYPEESLAVLTLDLCRNDENYQTTLKEMFDEVREQGICGVAVDLRENSGGDSSVIEQFLSYVDVDSYKTPVPDVRYGPILIRNQPQVLRNVESAEERFGGDLYVLTSPRTFSSAMMFAEVIGDNELGKIVGEAPGNDPNGYGEVTWIELPESGLIMQASTKQWHRIDDKEGLIEPDIAVPADEALEAARQEAATSAAEARKEEP